MPRIDDAIDSASASRDGHTFHDTWAARRALQLVFPNDDLSAIAVEGISSSETTNPGPKAEQVADLVLYYGTGETFQSSTRIETVQFKYLIRGGAVTASYLKKTIEKFADTILGYEKETSTEEVDKKSTFAFITNAEFKESLWEAIHSIRGGTTPSTREAKQQAQNLKGWCAGRGLADATRLFMRIAFRAGERGLSNQKNALQRTITAWSAGSDGEARSRLLELQDLVRRKASVVASHNNLIRREDVLDALNCEPDDLFPAETQFINVGTVIERAELSTINALVETSTPPHFHSCGWRSRKNGACSEPSRDNVGEI